jgi:hypothetical protein|tara:strand:+ start:249 stop:443 length:195 start_codon:yes stop_codon:yes gene_type:complete
MTMIDFDSARTPAQPYYDNGAATFSIWVFAPFLSVIKNDIYHRTMLVILLVTTVAGTVISETAQ